MRIHLSAFGWVGDGPAGHRLRWRYPADVRVDGTFLGLPDTVVVERAPLNADFVFQVEELMDPPPDWAVTPVGWWDDLGDLPVAPAGERFPLRGVQAVRFRYEGTAARIVAIDQDSPAAAFDRVVHHGEDVVIRGAYLAAVNVLALGFGNVLRRFRVLDLFADRGLPWEPVARLGVAASVEAPWSAVAPRHPATMAPEDWDQLRGLARTAMASSPFAPGGAGLTEWDAFHLALGMRWEHAVRFASGWYDGPRDGGPPSPLDDLPAPLGGLPTDAMAEAYRVVDPDGRFDVPASNIAIALNVLATDLGPPDPPTYEDAGVTVWPPQDPGSEAVDQRYVATYGLRWSSPDPRAIGVEVAEEVSASSMTGRPGEMLRYETRRGDRTGAAGGRLDRRIEVPFVDVTLTATVTSRDAWDRVSAPSPPASTLPPPRHAPHPPPLASATRDGDTVTLTQLVAGTDENGEPEPGPQHPWVPDRLVREAGGWVVVLRRLRPPSTAEVKVEVPVPTGPDGAHTVRLVDPPMFDAGPYRGGWLAAGGVRVRIDEVGSPGPSGTELRYRAPLDAWRSPVTFGAGAAVLSQDRGASQDPSGAPLWVLVVPFAADDVPEVLTFADPVDPSTDHAVTSSYATRVDFLGASGPVGNEVSVTWLPPVPAVPPPFEVTPLGRDFYDRTLVKVTLTTPEPGRYTVWWADGWLDDVHFPGQAAPGELGGQDAVGGVLYDVLPLPLPRRVERKVTYGLQRVNGAGGQSGFRLVTATLQPATA
jgi:hypothetical protein